MIHVEPAPRPLSLRESIARDRMILRTRPRTTQELAVWLREVLRIEPAPHPLLPHSDSPIHYLAHVFFEREPADAVVWASRGGGKTFYAAVATVLDLAFKPGIDVKILGGSLDQSRRMYEHLRRLFEAPRLARMIDGRITARRARLLNGSTVEILAQSQTSVRGTRPQRLRCDELELFDEDVWNAAQFVTRSKNCGGRLVRGSIEALSTCHTPAGLMSRLLASPAHRRVFRWTAIDALESCGDDRACASCPIQGECQGKAKNARRTPGHFLIDDAISMKRRADSDSWRSEILCERPTRHSAVFPEFDPARHVAPADAPPPARATRVAGMDFGFRAPTVILWALIDETETLRIVDERVASGVILEHHIRALTEREDGPPAWIGVDPAGLQRSDQTGLSPVLALRRAGLVVRHRRAPLEDGLRLIRTRLAPACGAPTLIIDPRCQTLIRCMQSYRYPDDPRVISPLKDGNDHAVDALRYLIINLHERRAAIVAPE